MSKQLLVACLVVLSLIGQGFHRPSRPPLGEPFILRGTAQGTTYQILYYSDGQVLTKQAVDSLLQRLDGIFSLYVSDTWVRRFNASTQGSPLHPEVLPVWRKAVEAYNITGRLADIAILPLTAKWKTVQLNRLPPPTKRAVQRWRSKSGMRWLEEKDGYLYKKKPGVQLDMDGIAQGYSVDRIAALLKEKGVTDYVVELGGEINAQGAKPATGEKMRIGLEKPMPTTAHSVSSLVFLRVGEGAITTSGNYRKFMESGGTLSSHIIDPRSGYPVTNELISVTLYAADALTADAYDHAVFAMGLQQGLAFVEAHPFLAGYFIFQDSNGQIRDTASTRFYPLFEHHSTNAPCP